MNRTKFCFKFVFFTANEEATLKTKQPIRFQGLLKITNQIAGNSYPTPPPKKKWMNLISNQLMISNRTRAGHLFDFEIMRMISAQIALHSVQLPLLI